MTTVLQNLTQITSLPREATEGNVHTGAPPPWFDATEGNQRDVRLKPEFSNFVSHSGKSSKLNPKRVGAAWAERRKKELELEKKGELVTNNFDANWLPNFGRVWQSGTRKESRKEFHKENKSSIEVESKSEKPILLQPYISKRMVRFASNMPYIISPILIMLFLSPYLESLLLSRICVLFRNRLSFIYIRNLD